MDRALPSQTIQPKIHDIFSDRALPTQFFKLSISIHIAASGHANHPEFTHVSSHPNRTSKSPSYLKDYVCITTDDSSSFSSTIHPITYFLSYDNISYGHQAFVLIISSHMLSN